MPQERTEWALICPLCRTDLGMLPMATSSVNCAACGSAYSRRDGVWRFLPADAQNRLMPFLDDYVRIRTAEGQGSSDPDYLGKLPAVSRDDPHAGIWRIRRQSYDSLIRRILPGFGNPLRILDLGAGVGWLSHRLAKLGHQPCAIDINLHGEDGLAATRHYDPDWPRLQAEFDRIPIASGSADLAIFNGSVHYSTDYRLTLREALRVIRPTGAVVIIDTPIYRDGTSGQRMVAELQADFEKRVGTLGDALPCLRYLTWDDIASLGHELQLRWRVLRPWYGMKWALKPLIARLRGTREPAQFALLVGQPMTDVAGSRRDFDAG